MDQTLLQSLFCRCVVMGDIPCPACPSCGDAEHFMLGPNGLISYAGCFSDDAHLNMTNFNKMVNAEKSMGLRHCLFCKENLYVPEDRTTPTCRPHEQKMVIQEKEIEDEWWPTYENTEVKQELKQEPTHYGWWEEVQTSNKEEIAEKYITDDEYWPGFEYMEVKPEEVQPQQRRSNRTPKPKIWTCC